jgi:hypothetical protein
MINECSVAWGGSLSSTEAEYIAIAESIKWAKWMNAVLKNCLVDYPISVLTDKQPSIHIAHSKMGENCQDK